MENSVLGNALEGVPEESEEDQPNDSKIESANNLDGWYKILFCLKEFPLSGKFSSTVHNNSTIRV